PDVNGQYHPVQLPHQYDLHHRGKHLGDQTGAAWASLITQVLTAVVQIVLVRQLHGVVLPVHIWVRTVLYAAGLVLALVGLAAAGLGPGTQLVFFAGAVLGLAFATGMIGRKVLYEAMEFRVPPKV
ncbi:MAG: hypothetical protein KBG86_07180, partial [Flavobacteriales bacterium]|nr:hypothetical protein [Flavobacteriales bacterium]